MTLDSSYAPPDERMVATVIPLDAAGRARSQAGPEASATASTPPPPIDDRVLRALETLRRRAGDLAAELPARVGRPVLRCEVLLAMGPTAIDASDTDPATAIRAADHLLMAGTAVIDLLDEETAVLGDALGCDLHDLRFAELGELADATLVLSTAPRATSQWGDPAAARAAEVVLRVAADDLRFAALTHSALYERFTEDVWQIPEKLLRSGRKHWRPVARVRLRSELRNASRSGKLPGRLSASSSVVLDARATRDRLADLTPLLTHHLADMYRGPFTDVDTVLEALTALRRLQTAMGDLLDRDRIHMLLLADAFRSPDVTGAAANVRSALQAWSADVATIGTADAGQMSPGDLGQWIAETSHLVPALVAGHEATVRLDVAAPTLRSLVDTLLLRESVQEMVDQLEPVDGPNRAWSAS